MGKNLFFNKYNRKLYINNINLEEYNESYHFIDNKKYKLHENSLDIIKNSKWYTGYGADWICQIQQYHHFINQRVIYVTGSTGAGKSTIYPLIMLYATKIINYNNNGKVVCTIPRIQPGENNMERIMNSIGFLVKREKNKNLLGDDNKLFFPSHFSPSRLKWGRKKKFHF